MEKDRAVRKKTEDPGTGRSIHTKRGERSNHDPRLNMIKEAGEIKEEDAADMISGNAILSLKSKKCSGIGSREEFAGPKLAWTQKVMTKVEGAKAGGYNLL